MREVANGTTCDRMEAPVRSWDFDISKKSFQFQGFSFPFELAQSSVAKLLQLIVLGWVFAESKGQSKLVKIRPQNKLSISDLKNALTPVCLIYLYATLSTIHGADHTQHSRHQ